MQSIRSLCADQHGKLLPVRVQTIGIYKLSDQQQDFSKHSANSVPTKKEKAVWNFLGEQVNQSFRRNEMKTRT
jgi:hypothetical protein